MAAPESPSPSPAAAPNPARARRAPPRPRSPLAELLSLLRPDHWIKNTVVLAPLVFAGLALDPPSIENAALMTAAFCLLSSFGYVVNDLADVRADDRHPAKRRRALPRGAANAFHALALALSCLAGGLLLAWFVHGRAPPLADAGAARLGPRGWALAYAALTLAYTFVFKRIAPLDVLAIAAGFVLRAWAGASALQLTPSRWLLLCGFLLALFLALGKRRLEFFGRGVEARHTRPMRVPWPPRALAALFHAAALAVVLAWVAYSVAPDTRARVGSIELLLTSPVVALLVGRHWRAVRAGRGHDPVEMLLRDPISVAGFLLWSAGVLLVVYRPW